MSDVNENKTFEEIKNEMENWNPNSGDNLWYFIVLMLVFGFGWNSPENPRITELEKKVARLEGQMSMIGGKTA